MNYYTLYKNSKDPSLLRKELVSYALKYGNKKSCTPLSNHRKNGQKMEKTVAGKKGAALKDLSKKPKKSPCMMKMYWQFKIKSIAEKASADNKRINGAMTKREYSIPYCGKTIVKYLKQYYKLSSKKTHREKKRDMREIKSSYRAFEKIQVDIKYLDESPNIRLGTSFACRRNSTCCLEPADIPVGFCSTATEGSASNQKAMFFVPQKTRVKQLTRMSIA